MSYSVIPKYKLIDKCSQCGDTNCKGRKRGKEYICLNCVRGIDSKKSVDKAAQRDKENAIKELKPKEKKQLRRSVANSVRGLANTQQNKENISKSKLLKLADAAYARFIRTRDTHNGKILCPCCNKEFDALAVDKDGKMIANCMHFINRNVYSYRFREDFAAAGHANCNRNQHLNPTGVEYQNFKQYLVNLLGEQEVAEAEIAHRQINKLEVTVLKNVIEHYNGI